MQEHFLSSWSQEHPEPLAEALREQGATSAEIEDVMPALLRLSEWQVPQPSAADTQRLLVRLVAALPASTSARQAIRAHQDRRRYGLSWLLITARTQVSLFGPAFWLVSLLVTLLGVGIVLSHGLPDQAFFLRASGPFLAYLGTSVAFRSAGVHTLECELVCLPSPLQLAVARLVIVLGYDVGLGCILSLALWAGGAGHVLALTCSWLMPLLLVAGLALLLSLRLPVSASAALAYGSWLLLLALDATFSPQIFPLTLQTEALLGSLGLLLLAIALLRLPARLDGLLPHA